MFFLRGVEFDGDWGADVGSNAWRCRGVGRASLVMCAPPVKTMVLRVRVADFVEEGGVAVDGLAVVVALA